MDLDLDALCTPELKVKAKGKEYIVGELEADAYLSAIMSGAEMGTDPSKNLETLRKMVLALGPGLPKEVVNGCSMRQLNTLLKRLDAFQGGAVSGDEGNALAGGGSR